MAKKQFKVQAETIGYTYLIVEAESAEEANQIAENADAGDFITDEQESGEFNILNSLTELVAK